MNDNSDILEYILNETNVPITTKYIENMLNTYNINYKVNNIKLFQKAMVHKSYIKRDFDKDKSLKNIRERNINIDIDIEKRKKIMPLQDESYERFEFLGDSIIHAIFADYLFNRYPDQNEGFMTKLRTKLENGTTMYQLAKMIGLSKYIIIGKYTEDMNTRDRHTSILEDAFEAFIAALYLDSNSKIKFGEKNNFNLCHKFIISIIETKIDIASLLAYESNYKDLLLQYHHKKRWIDPEYVMSEIINTSDKKEFKMHVKDNKGEILVFGIGTSKKAGEQEAAKFALIKYGIIKSNETAESEDEEDYY
jgi:ribonuclease-3